LILLDLFERHTSRVLPTNQKERRTTMLFEVAVLVTPTVNEKEEGKLEEIVLHPQFIIAADAQSASMQVIMDNTEALTKVDKSRLQVLVRPF
jgi:hypothetical protein